MKLKPCPFCGGEARKQAGILDGIKVIYVVCEKCGASSCLYKTMKPRVKDEENPTIRLWNTRKPIDEIITKLESRFMAEENRFRMGVYLDVIEMLKGASNEADRC